MKKIILGLGTIATITIPVATVVSCSIDSTGNISNDNSKLTNKEFKAGITELVHAIKELKGDA